MFQGLVQLFTVATASSHLQFGHRLHVYIQPLGASVIVLGLVVLVIGSFSLRSNSFNNALRPQAFCAILQCRRHSLRATSRLHEVRRLS
jgi:hypothetical protein